MSHQVGVDCKFRCMLCGCMRDDLDDGLVETARVSAERKRLADKMRADYPMNQHALEWADWIERESTTAPYGLMEPEEESGSWGD